MKLGITISVLLVFGVMGVPGLQAQAPPQNPPSKPAAPSNPFPGDTNNVPVLPNGDSPPIAHAPDNAPSETASPTADVDPVRSPDDPIQDTSDAEGFSSSAAGMERVVPPPDTDISDRRAKGKGAPALEHQETAAEDEKVGDYYLDQKNWKAALSRYESAVVLDPENPDVYWGLGEAQRHLGKLAEAKAAYQKLVEYDPESKHGKEAGKMLKEPELANAPTASAKQP